MAFPGNTSSYAPGASKGKKEEEESSFGGATTDVAPGASSKKFMEDRVDKLQLNKMYGGDGITKRDLRAAREAGMSEKQIQKQYDAHVAAGGKVHSGAQARMDDFDAVDKLKNYRADEVSGRNLGEGNKQPDLRRVEMQSLLGEAKGFANQGKDGEGFSAKDVNKMIKERGYTLGSGAQDLLNKRLESLGSKTRTDITDPEDGTPVMDTNPLPTKEEVSIKNSANTNLGKGAKMGTADMSITDSFNQDKFNNAKITNTLGEGAMNFGNMGQIDNSITMNAIGGGGGAGGAATRERMSDGSINPALAYNPNDNMFSTGNTLGLLTNLQKRSEDGFGTRRAAEASAAANRITGADERIKDMDQRAYDSILYNKSMSDLKELNWLGDMDAITSRLPMSDWASTAKPKEYKLDFEQ